jgi:hypothetical protein
MIRQPKRYEIGLLLFHFMLKPSISHQVSDVLSKKELEGVLVKVQVEVNEAVMEVVAERKEIKIEKQY